MDKDQHETASEARRNALAFSMGFGELRSSDTLVERVDELLEGYSLVNITAVNIPDSVKFGKTKDPSKNALADYTLYRKTHFSSRKCSPECPYCCRARQKRVVKEAGPLVGFGAYGTDLNRYHGEGNPEVVYYRSVQGISGIQQWFYPVKKQKNGSWKGPMVTWYMDERSPRKGAMTSVNKAFARELKAVAIADVDSKVKTKFAQKGVDL